MTDYQQTLNRISNYAQIIDDLKQGVSNLRLPYAYFKKYNILPLNFVEGELDKYFEYDRLVFEDLYSDPEKQPQLDSYRITPYIDIHDWFNDNFWMKFYKIHNLNSNIFKHTTEFHDKVIIDNQIFPNLDYYFNKGAIEEEKYYEIITIPLENIVKTIKMYGEYVFSHTKILVEMDNQVYDKIPGDELPIGSVVFCGCSSINDGLIVDKICPKMIKFRKHSDPEKKFQIHKDKFAQIPKYQVYSMRDREYANGVYQYKNNEVVFTTERKCLFVNKWVEE